MNFLYFHCNFQPH